MPTPLGHGLAGLAVWAVARKPGSVKEALTRENIGWAALCVVAANIPDADFITIGAGGIEISELYHHGATHSAGFAVALGAVAGVWAWLRRKASGGTAGNFAPNPVMAAGVTFVCVLSHAVMDLMGVDSNPINGIGLPILWPVSNEYFLVPIMPGVDRTNPFSLSVALGVARETLIFGFIFLMALFHGRRRTALAPAPARNETGPVI